jgi:methionine-rich copper-binding protein CopC
MMEREMYRLLLAAFVATAFAASTGPAAAHAHLVSSVPAADSSVTSLERITVKFTEPVEAALSGIVLTEADGTTIQTNALPSSEKTELSFSIGQALTAGSYRVHWHAIAADTHKSEGEFTFTVK